MNLEVVGLPKDVVSEALLGRTVVVFDVLRATSTMTAALAAGVKQIRVFGDCDLAKSAAAAVGDGPLLCGEIKCLKPEGFDLGNSPGGLDPSLHAARELYMSTTNGTRAILAARDAALLLTGALVNRSAVARAVERAGLDVTLLCAGTDGQIAMEDLIGAGAVIDAVREVRLVSDLARAALALFRASRDRLVETLRDATGGQNVIRAGLPEDVSFCAQLDRFNVVGRVLPDPVRVVRY